MVLYHSVFLLTVYLTACFGKIPEQSPCDLREVTVLTASRCSDHKGDIVQVRGQTTVPSRTSCIFVCNDSQVQTWLQCFHGRWGGPDPSKECHPDVRYRTNHVRRVKRGWWRRTVRAVGNFFRGVFRTIGCFFCFCRCGPPPDRTPPTLKCPSNINAVADPIQVNTAVGWTEPSAYDNKDGSITPTRSGRAPGKLFSEGTTRVGYYARDRSGNMARCEFRVTVTVTRCPELSRMTDGYYQCFPNWDMRRGAVCWLGCYAGHDLQGSSRIECTDSGQWSDTQPYCKKKTCLPIPLRQPLTTVTCTDGFNYRSKCTYTCDAGYGIPDGRNRLSVCTADETWLGNVSSCVDIAPPEFIDCPYAVLGYVERGQSRGRVFFEEKVRVQDNSGDIIQANQTSGPSSGTELPVGVYDVIYLAADMQGNQARPCEFKVVVKMLTCPTIYATPYLTVTCPTGSRYGSRCDLSCMGSTVANGSDVITCEKAASGPFGYWTWAGHGLQTFCQVVEQCPVLPPPDYGAVACDYWTGGKFCQMLCQSGYDFERHYPLWVCGSSGQWTPMGTEPPAQCHVRLAFGPSSTTLKMEAYYYFPAGQCSDPVVQENIKKNFTIALTNSSFSVVCTGDPRCTYENVEVKCGKYTGRKRRSAEEELTVSVTFVFTSDSDMNSGIYRRMDAAARSLVDSLKEDTKKRIMDVIVNGITMVLKSMEHGNLTLRCPAGYVPTAKDIGCVQCSPGTYRSEDDAVCQPCPRGHFQPDSGQSFCVSCPIGMSSPMKGAVSSNGCEEACYPGTWSDNSVTPCSLCPAGSYQPEYGATVCLPCRGSNTTQNEGSTTMVECKEFDVSFASSIGTTTAQLRIENKEELSSFQVSLWTMCKICSDVSVFQIGTLDGIVVLALRHAAELVVESHGSSMSTGVTISESQWHHVIVRVTPSTLELVSNGELIYGPVNISSMEPIRLQSVVAVTLGGDGFLGSISQFNVWTVHRDLQALVDLSYACSAAESGDWFGWKGFERATLEDSYFQISSQCDDNDECLSAPCQYGYCTNLLGSYSCSCYQGYTGDHCHMNIDDCLEHACHNSSTCVDGVSGYTCACPSGVSGDLCEVAVVDGHWSEWGNWSDCSVTCESGVRTRTRVCDSPAPDNDGIECEGEPSETETCLTESCPSCTLLEPPANGTISCETDDVTGTMSCTIECDDHFEFDIAPLDLYYCGLETFYEWNFNTSDNAYGRLPFCSPIETPKKMTAVFQARYLGLFCDTLHNEQITTETIIDVVEAAAERAPCVISGQCVLDNVAVSNCDNRGRKKRELESDSSVGFEVTFSASPLTDGLEETYLAIIAALNFMQDMADDETLNAYILSNLYVIETNTSEATGGASCRTGSIQVSFYCVPCALGSFQNDSICEWCDYGTYQDTLGQSFCKQCPAGFTTKGMGSRDILECSVSVPISDSATETLATAFAAVGGIVGGAICICVGAFLAAILLRKKSIKKLIPDPSGVPDIHHQDTPKPMFDSSRLATYQSQATFFNTPPFSTQESSRPPTPVQFNNFVGEL